MSSVARLLGVRGCRVPVLGGLDVAGARNLAAAVPASDIVGELVREDEARELRRARRENRGGSGRRQHCGSCQWVLRNAAQPCPRCGFTNGYGYPR